MNDYIYAIFDKLGARYGSPFAACNDLVAARLALMIKGGYNKAFDCLYIYMPDDTNRPKRSEGR